MPGWLCCLMFMDDDVDALKVLHQPRTASQPRLSTGARSTCS
ncbi:hypothetical protein CGLO_07140 [Colletotrichum gloeosporioides Cg-14]|uniref:Uncharacterized protein n=1 Tax=Colletotrichum gloeosporioides (strain Cg-14) TaxID=1237896 RepID=T0KK24_COLGC|nr:hypothetical protein CGLO_07140 [Colletotrichum gloeosporioides Cg-14]